ncbi:hypothetical protein DFH09DRAFT_1286082 [Mycena vulgaris]|nr:hypothetical protein DFH09DRAFT_1286082 [Mycena vulgaris]
MPVPVELYYTLQNSRLAKLSMEAAMHRPSHILQQRQGPDSNQDLPRFTSFLSTTIAGVEAAAIGSPVPGSVANSRGEFTGIKTWKTVREMEGAHRSLGQTRYRKLTLQEYTMSLILHLDLKRGVPQCRTVNIGEARHRSAADGKAKEWKISEFLPTDARFDYKLGWEVQDIDSCADVPAMLGWTFETSGQLFVTRDGGMGTERTNGSRTKQKRGYAQKPLALREWRNWRVDVDSIRVVHLHRYTLRRPLRRSRRGEAQAESVERVRHCDKWSARRAGNLDIQYRLGI